MRSIAISLILACCLLPAASKAAEFSCAAMEQVQLGMTEAEVLGLLGTPLASSISGKETASDPKVRKYLSIDYGIGLQDKVIGKLPNPDDYDIYLQWRAKKKGPNGERIQGNVIFTADKKVLRTISPSCAIDKR